MNKLIKRILLVSEGKNLKDKLKIFFSVLSFNNYKPKVFLRNKDGVFFVRHNSSDLWMLSTSGESELRPFFNLREGTFLDIGANVGKYSIIIGNQLKDKGKVFSFEPEPSNLISLNKNIKLNNLDNVEIIQVACSYKKGKLVFYIDSENSGGHSLIKKTKNKIFVNADTIDNIVRVKKIDNIKLIKVDVEGAEMDVFMGAKKTLLKYKPKLIFETDFPEKILPLLKSIGYRIKKVSKRDYFAE